MSILHSRGLKQQLRDTELDRPLERLAVAKVKVRVVGWEAPWTMWGQQIEDWTWTVQSKFAES